MGPGHLSFVLRMMISRHQLPKSKGHIYMCIGDQAGGWRPPHPPQSTKNCESGFGQLVIAHARSAKVGICKTAPAKNGSIFL